MIRRNTIENIGLGFVAIAALVGTAGIVVRSYRGPEPPNAAPPVREANWRVAVNDKEVMGSIEASDTVLVFSDFQCPFCKVLATVLHRVSSAHEIVIIHRNYPLDPIHPFARPAALAAACAARQNHFAEYHDYLFAQDSLSATNWTQAAVAVGVEDTVTFGACMRGQETGSDLAEDIRSANSLGITGTPLVLVNGWRFSGTPSREDIQEALEYPKER